MARDIYFNKARVNWYNEWHRQIQNDHWRMIDIDSYEYCNECRNGIAIIETTYDVGKYNKLRSQKLMPFWRKLTLFLRDL